MLHTYFRKQPCLTLQRCQAGLFFNENVLLQIEFQNYRCNTRSRISWVRPWFQYWVPM